MRSELLTACVKHRNVSGAYALFLEGVEDGEPPPEAQCAALIEQLCTRGMGANCRTALAAMADHGYKLTVRLCTMTVGALLRSGQPMRGFEVFAETMERAGSAADGAAVGSLAASDANVEHTLALLSKALAKKMHGGRAHRVYACALSAGVVTNVGSWALPALCLACVETGHLREAISLCDDARRALIALDTVTASALVKAVAAAKLVDDGKNLLPELAAKRLAADPPSMRALLELLLAAKPQPLAEAAQLYGLLAKSLVPTKPAAGAAGAGGAHADAARAPKGTPSFGNKCRRCCTAWWRRRWGRRRRARRWR